MATHRTHAAAAVVHYDGGRWRRCLTTDEEADLFGYPPTPTHIPGISPSCPIIEATSGWARKETIFPSLMEAK